MAPTFYGEVQQRQGSWVTRHATADDAARWTSGRQQADLDTVNPVLDVNVREQRDAATLPPSSETDCPKCGDPVVASTGIHFDCRDT